MGASYAARHHARRAPDQRWPIVVLAAAGLIGIALILALDIVVDWDRSPQMRARFLLVAVGIVGIVTVMAIYLLSRRAVAAALADLPAATAHESAALELLHEIRDGVCLFDAQQRLVLANDRFAGMLNIPARWLRPGVEFAEIASFVRDSTGAAIPAWPDTDGRAAPLAARQPDNGRALEIVVRQAPSGGLLLVVSDVTVLQRANAESHEARIEADIAVKERAGFLATMSHELRTPLNAIIGFTDMMATEIFGPLGHPTYREYVEDIRQSSRHLLQIITDILEMAKIEAGRRELHETSVDVAAAAQFCERLLRARAARGHLRIELAIATDLPRLQADERLVKQMLLNLLSNAVKFTPSGGRITIGAEVDARGRLVLAVRDTGIGIAASDIAKALTPFAQIDNAYTRRHRGTGLGLPIVKAHAELHGAAFAIDSEPGKGTCVRIVFPRARVLAPAESPNENGGP